jgi:hypothetical protein
MSLMPRMIASTSPKESWNPWMTGSSASAPPAAEAAVEAGKRKMLAESSDTASPRSAAPAD